MGVIVNPTSRLALIASCTDACDGELTTEWNAFDMADNPLNLPGDRFSSELALETDTFFAANPGLTNFNLEATITNEFGLVGSSIYYMIVNVPPDAPYHDPAATVVPATESNAECRVFPGTGRALVDKFNLTCNQWFDPDDIGLVDYRVECEQIISCMFLFFYLILHAVVLPTCIGIYFHWILHIFFFHCRVQY